MKRFISIFMCLIILTGCSNFKLKDVKNEPLNFSGFNCCVYTVNNNIKIVANVKYQIDGIMKFEFEEPATIKDIYAEFDNENLIIKNDSLTFKYPLNKMPVNMICRAVKLCADSVKGAEIKKDGQNLYVSFENDNHIFNLFLDAENKSFVKLNIDGTDTIFFESFAYIK